MKRLRNWLLSIGNAVVAGQRREIYALRNQIAAMRRKTEQDADEWTKTQAGVNRTCRDVMAERDRYERLLNAVKEGIGFEPLDNAWQETPAAARHAVGSHVDAKVAAFELRASKAEKDAEDLRTTLADERQQHEQTRGALHAAEAENAAVWAVIERDRKRVEAETAIATRRKAAAETDAKRRAEDDE